MSVKNKLDKYYFDHSFGKKKVIEIVKENPEAAVFIEPSAGDGAFSTPLKIMGKRCIAIDIAPEADNIIKHDFFTFPWEKYFLPTSNKIVIILSPPFGTNNKIATKFFNDCAKKGDTIYFICSRVFKKPHTHKRLNKYFHLEHCEDLPESVFTVNKEQCNLRCCIQKWVRKDIKRKVIIKRESKYFNFVEKGKKCHFRICYTGSRAGEMVDSNKKVYRIKFKPGYKWVLKYVKNWIDLSEAANNTISIKSVTKYEIIKALEKVIKG